MSDAQDRRPIADAEIPGDVQAAYDALEQDAPPALLDQAVLNRAHAAVEKHGSRRPWSFGWLHGLSTAAVIVLGATVLFQLRDEAPGTLAPPPIPQGRNVELRAPLSDGMQEASPASDAVEIAQDMEEDKAGAALSAQRSERLRQGAVPAVAGEQAPAAAAVREAPATDASAPAALLIEETSTPEEAIEVIRALRAAGRTSEAGEAIAAFQARWPGHLLPESLQP